MQLFKQQKSHGALWQLNDKHELLLGKSTLEK